ncbi:MAG: response regulator [Candidatus Latescibacteria bacterium]|nr:response regulator [Candidatus Latescibacterota bacterium]NIO55229.1 response regulator [Candidatus Latescibacterota bacterium]
MESKIKVLLVDDEEIVGKRLKIALEKDGYAIEVYQSGQEAIDRLKKELFDIVVADIRMDEVNGLDVLQAVQENSPRSKTIMITGYATVELAREAQAKGAFGFIAKPFRPKELRKLLEKATRELKKSSEAE